MLKRTFEADSLNAVANHPAVRPWLLGAGPVDMSPLVADCANVALVNDDGGFLLTPSGLGDYEVHTMFVPGAVDPLAAARECAAWMFSRTDCMRIVTKVPRANVRARALADAMGFRLLFVVPDWDCLGLEIDDWAMGLAASPYAAARAACDMMLGAGSAGKASAWLARWLTLAGVPQITAPTFEEAA